MSATAIAAAAALLTTRTAEAASFTDADIFNFALNFEYLGAEYYLRGTLGSSLAAQGVNVTGTGTQGTVMYPSGAASVPWSTTVLYDFFIQLAVDETAHVEFVRAALKAEGADPIAEPTIDFGAAYTTIAQAAGLITAGQTFNPFASEVNFLLGSYLLEDVCVTALTGAANLLTSRTNLAYAAGLLGAESQQAGAVRGFCAQFGLNQATDAISALRAKLSGIGDNGTGDQSNPFNISNGDGEAQAYRRTPSQVLAIAYAGAGQSKGGIFPSGVNGLFNQS